MADRPLQGVGVLVTRPRTQAIELVNAIEAQGGDAYCFPVIDIVPLDEFDIRGAADLGLVPCDEHAILGDDEIGLDEQQAAMLFRENAVRILELSSPQ